MDKDYFIKLTLAVYRVTDLLPKEEPLRLKIREKALDILTGLLSVNPHPAQKALWADIEIIKTLFDLAKNQNWVGPLNFLVLKREYDKIGKEIKNSVSEKETPNVFLKNPSISQERQKALPRKSTKNFLARHKKILEILKEKGRAQVGELKKFFPEVTKRTLRRDFEKLCQKGLIIREGANNNTFYMFKARTDSS